MSNISEGNRGCETQFQRQKQERPPSTNNKRVFFGVCINHLPVPVHSSSEINSENNNMAND